MIYIILYNNIQKFSISLHRLGNQYIVHLQIKYRYISIAGVNLDNILDKTVILDRRRITF